MSSHIITGLLSMLKVDVNEMCSKHNETENLMQIQGALSTDGSLLKSEFFFVNKINV